MPRPASKTAKAAATKKPASRARAAKDPTKSLSVREEAFVREYLIDLNASRAATAAGYKTRPNQAGLELMQRPHIAAAIQAAQQARAVRTEITQDRVLTELAALAFFDPRQLFRADGTPIPVCELPEQVARAVVGLKVVTRGNAEMGFGEVQEIKLADKRASLEMVMRHLGMFKDKLDVNVQGRIILVPRKDAPLDKLPDDPPAKGGVS